MSPVGRDPAGRRAGRREWAGLAVLALPCMLISMDLSVLHLAVPNLSADLKPTSSQLLWIVDIYGFLVAGSLITMGTVGDRIGRRRLLLTGAAAFGSASVLASLSSSAEMLIATRALLGVSGATLMPSTMALIRNMFEDPRQRTAALGVWMSSFSVGAAVGPLVGGVLLEHFWWGSAFLPGVPVMALLLVTGPLLLPEHRGPTPGRVDLVSAGTSLAAVLSVIYGIKRIAEQGVRPSALLCIGTGLILGIVFLRRQCTLAHPFLDVSLFRERSFSVSLVTVMLGIFVAFGGFLYIAQYMQLVLGLTPLEAGLWMLPQTVGFVVAAMLTPLMVRRIRPSFLMGSGMAVTAAGFVILMQAGPAKGLAAVVAGSLVIFVGFGPPVTLGTDLMLAAPPPERAGAAAAISETANEFGGALGIAIMGSIGTAIYRSQMTGSVTDGIPRAAAQTARDTLGGTLGVVENLPVEMGTALLGAARASFVDGFRATALIGALVSVLVAVFTSVLLRHVMPSRQSQDMPALKLEKIPAGPLDEATQAAGASL